MWLLLCCVVLSCRAGPPHTLTGQVGGGLAQTLFTCWMLCCHVREGHNHVTGGVCSAFTLSQCLLVTAFEKRREVVLELQWFQA